MNDISNCYYKSISPSSEIETNPFIKLMYLLINNTSDETENYLVNYINNNIDDINKTNDEGWSPLHILCRNSRKIDKNLVLTKLLIEKGAKLDLQSNDGSTALMLSSMFSNIDSNIETVKLLLDKGANINLQDQNGWSALMSACYCSNNYSNIETVKLLIEKGAKLDLQDENGYTALMLVCRFSGLYSNIETVKLLLDKGANLDLQDKIGYTALMYACHYSKSSSNIETVKLLIDKGANIDLRNNYGYNALILACFYSNTIISIETVKLLIEKGAFLDINLINDNNIIQQLAKEPVQELFRLVQDYYIDVVHHKLCMRKIIKDIRKKSNNFKADNASRKLLAIK